MEIECSDYLSLIEVDKKLVKHAVADTACLTSTRN